jgi:hypothetical protein
LTPSGNKIALNKERNNRANTIIFGRLIDLNPQSLKEKLPYENIHVRRSSEIEDCRKLFTTQRE